MAKIKPYVEPTFWAYFDKKTGAIFTVTNELDKKQKNRIEIPKELHERLASGKEKFSDYTVGYLRQADSSTILSITAKKDLAFIFKNTMLEVITEPPTDKTNLSVEWNLTKRTWTFGLSEDARERLALKFGDIKLAFFITLENDFDFLIRSIVIDNSELATRGRIEIPFEHRIEDEIKKITISTKIVYESYGLIIND